MERESSGGVQQPVAERFWFADRELALEAQPLGPRDQVLRDQRQLEPHRVERELAEREVLKPCLFRTPDQVLSVAAAAVQTLDLDCVAGEIGERRLEAVSVVSVNFSCAPGCGRSRRMITRDPSGHGVRSNRST